MENRTRAAAALGLPAESLSTAYQVHSAKVETIDAPVAYKDAPRADGFVTATPGVLLGIRRVRMTRGQATQPHSVAKLGCGQ